MDDQAKFRRNVALVASLHVLVIGGGVWLALRHETPPEPEEKIEWLDQGAFGPAVGALPVAAPEPPPAAAPR